MNDLTKLLTGETLTALIVLMSLFTACTAGCSGASKDNWTFPTNSDVKAMQEDEFDYVLSQNKSTHRLVAGVGKTLATTPEQAAQIDGLLAGTFSDADASHSEAVGITHARTAGGGWAALIQENWIEILLGTVLGWFGIDLKFGKSRQAKAVGKQASDEFTKTSAALALHSLTGGVKPNGNGTTPPAAPA